MLPAPNEEAELHYAVKLMELRKGVEDEAGRLANG
jgi:hypothetical protein